MSGKFDPFLAAFPLLAGPTIVAYATIDLAFTICALVGVVGVSQVGSSTMLSNSILPFSLTKCSKKNFPRHTGPNPFNSRGLPPRYLPNRRLGC